MAFIFLPIGVSKKLEIKPIPATSAIVPRMPFIIFPINEPSFLSLSFLLSFAVVFSFDCFSKILDKISSTFLLISTILTLTILGVPTAASGAVGTPKPPLKDLLRTFKLSLNSLTFVNAPIIAVLNAEKLGTFKLSLNFFTFVNAPFIAVLNAEKLGTFKLSLNSLTFVNAPSNALLNAETLGTLKLSLNSLTFVNAPIISRLNAEKLGTLKLSPKSLTFVNAPSNALLNAEKLVLFRLFLNSVTFSTALFTPLIKVFKFGILNAFIFLVKSSILFSKFLINLPSILNGEFLLLNNSKILSAM